MSKSDWLDEVVVIKGYGGKTATLKHYPEAKQAILDHIDKALDGLAIDTRPLLYPDGTKYADEVYIKGLAELRTELGIIDKEVIYGIK